MEEVWVEEDTCLSHLYFPNSWLISMTVKKVVFQPTITKSQLPIHQTNTNTIVQRGHQSLVPFTNA
jgi:hypothetical protein